MDSARLFDTVVAAYLLDSVRSDFTDAYLAETYLHASLKALLHELSPIDSSEAELLDPLAVDSARLFDTVVAAYLLDSVRSDFTDAYLAETYLHASLPSAAGEDGAPADAVSIAARGAWLARTLREPLASALEAQGTQ